MLDNLEIEHADKYKYLGTFISNTSNDHFKFNYSYLRGKALRGIAGFRQDVKKAIGTSLPINLSFKSFDAQIRPILDYGCELWCKPDPIQDIEFVQNFFIKSSLRLRDSTPTPAILGDTGRYPLYLKQHELILRYLVRLETMNKSRILYNIFSDLTLLHSSGHSNWVTKAFKIRQIYHAATDIIPKNRNSCIYDFYVNKWLNNINDATKCPKLRTYKRFKSEFKIEPYLTETHNTNYTIALARLRTSAHNLHIEKGRHTVPTTDISKRTCTFCNLNAIDDEPHFLIHCPFHAVLRNKLLKIFENDIPEFLSMSDSDRFVYIMSSESRDVFFNLAKFVFECFKHRDAHSQILAL